MTCLVDVGLLPCGRRGGPVGTGLDPFDVQLAPLGRVPRQFCVVLHVGGEVAKILRFLNVREIRGHLEYLGADHEACREVLVVACLRSPLVALDPFGVALDPFGVAVDERGAHHGGIGARLQHLDVVPLAQLLADAALCVTGGLVFVTERDGRLVGPGDVAQLGLVPPRRLVDGSQLGSCCDPLRVELRLQLTCFFKVAARRPLRGRPQCLGRCPGELRCARSRPY